MTDRPRRPEDDAALSALLDDALPAEEAERLRCRLGAEPALADRLDQLRAVDATVRRAHAGIAQEPVPQSVVDLLRAQPQDPRFGTRHPPRRRFGWTSAAAAGVALAAGFALAFVILPREPPAGPLQAIAGGGIVEPDSQLHAVLTATPSGESRVAGAWSATPRLTFRDRTGRPCRRVDLAGAAGSIETVACRREGAWRLELVAFGSAGAAPSGGDYRPAGDAPSRVDPAIDAMIAGSPLDRDAEQAWIDRGWD